MPPEYDVWQFIGAVFVMATFIPLLFTKPIQRLAESLLYSSYRALRPSRSHCEVLTWGEVREIGPLHRQVCSHPLLHNNNKQEGSSRCCWSGIHSLLRCYSGNPKLLRRERLPKELSGRYLCIDLYVLNAIILCTAPDNKDISWREGRMSYTRSAGSSEGIIFESIRWVSPKVLVAHLSISTLHPRLDWNKHELSRIMEGYPPFYREVVVCRHGPQMPFPIYSLRDVERAGWVIAVGLMDERIQASSLYVTPYLRAAQSDGSYYARTNGALMRNAVRRVFDILCYIQSSIPNDSDLDLVANAVQYMVEQRTGSGVERILPGREVPGGNIARLSRADCQFAMEIFNEMTLSEEQVARLRSILKHVLQATFSGSYTVIQYLKDTGLRLVLPGELRDSDMSTKIYLEDCSV